MRTVRALVSTLGVMGVISAYACLFTNGLLRIRYRKIGTEGVPCLVKMTAGMWPTFL